MGQDTLNGLQVVELTAENIMGIRSAKVGFGDQTVLFGANGACKTSLYRALCAAFEGLPAEIMRKGESESSVLLRLANGSEKYDIKRSRTADRGQKIEVRDRNGSPVPRPAEFLSGLLGDFSLDPAKFAMASGEEQVEIFCNAFRTRLAGPGVPELAERYGIDLAANGFLVLERIAERLEEDRREAGVEKRKALSVAEEFKPADPTIVRPAKEAREAAAKKVEDAAGARMSVAETNNAISARNARRKALRDAIAVESAGGTREVQALEARIQSLREEIEEKKRALEAAKDNLGKKKAHAEERVAAATKAAKDAGEDEALVSEEEAVNALVAARLEAANLAELDAQAAKVELWQEKVKIAEQKAADWAAIDDVINEKVRGEWLRTLWRQIKTPIKGLALGQNDKGKTCLTLDGIPLAEVNTAARVRVGTRIAAALNKDYPVKILAVDDAEHLTPSNRRLLAEEAAAAGFQVLMMIAADPEDVPVGGLLIEGGTIRKIE